MRDYLTAHPRVLILCCVLAGASGYLALRAVTILYQDHLTVQQLLTIEVARQQTQRASSGS